MRNEVENNPNKLRKKGAERGWELVVRRELKEDSKQRFKKKKKQSTVNGTRTRGLVYCSKL